MPPEEKDIDFIIGECRRRNVAIITMSDDTCIGCGSKHLLVCAKFFPTIPVTISGTLFQGGVCVFVCGNCTVRNNRPALEKAIIYSIHSSRATTIENRTSSDDSQYDI